MKRRHDDRQPTLFDAAPAPGDGPAALAAVAEPDAAYRPGFKKVKRIGWVPEDWDALTMRKLTSKVGSGTTPRGGAAAYVARGVIFIRSQNVYPGELRLNDVVCISKEQHASMNATQLRHGDVLLNITGASIGRSCVVPNWLGEANVNQHVCIIRSNGRAEPYFLSSVLNADIGQSQIYSFQAGGNREGLNFDQIRRFWIPVPPLPEQRKIARILGTWDRALAQLDALIATKEQRLKGLMQLLLFGQERFPEFEEQPWREVRIGKILKEVNRSPDFSVGESLRLLSVRRRSEGLFIRDSEEIQGNLKVVHEGDFLISRRQVVHGASGLARAEHHGAAVSNSYSVLVSHDPEILDIRFFNWLSKTPELYHIAYLASYGVHIEKFIFHLRFYFKHKVRIPRDVEEQRKIVAVLDDAEAEIELLRRERDALAKQKKGLMQRLLTGAVRVTPDAEDDIPHRST